MAFRGNEMGMDFEYENRTGPMDSRSPFARVANNVQRLPPSSVNMNRKRPYSVYDSPQKSATPSHHNSPNKPLPPMPGSAFNSIFSTPRKPVADFDDSSAGETPRSPERDDSNAPTPENMGLRSALTKWSQNGQSQSQAGAERGGRDAPIDLDLDLDLDGRRERERPSPLKQRNSFFGRIKEKISSPGRGEIARTDRTQAVSKHARDKKERSLQKVSRRRKQHSASDSEGEGELQRRKSPRKASGTRQKSVEEPSLNQPHWVSNLFTFIGQHPTVPHILSFYAQLAFNVFLLAACAYMIYCFWAAVQGDIDKKAFEAMAEVMAESAQCLHEWNLNRCDRATRVPAVEKLCENWQACMNRDATKIGRARVSAHTFAEIFNSFVEPISWKAMVFTTFIVFGGFATTNMAFGHFRDKAQHQHHQQPQYFPPPTPQRSFSGQPGEGYYGTPWHPQASLEPQGSPVRRIAGGYE